MESTIYSKVTDFCTKHSIFSPGDTVLIALSGGGDSVCLLHLVLSMQDQYGITVEAAHLNHALRGKESDDDEQFCREICSQLSVFLSVRKLPKGEICKKKESIETTAREVRRSFLEQTKRDRGLSIIATGHTADDQAWIGHAGACRRRGL